MEINKTDRYLMLVESPNKIKSISAILKELGYKNIVVQASVGHISRLNDSGDFNLGIDPKTFDMDLVVSKDKKDIVSKLAEQVKFSKGVIIASDPDREGEAIAWSLKKFLGIPDKDYVRITYHEITKPAIEAALKNASKIDNKLVEAAHTRNCLDKMVGYRLSPLAQQELRAKSVGRCQSAGLKLVVDREKEILNFKEETYYELYVNFEKNKTPFKAKFVGEDNKEYNKFKSKGDCDKVALSCKGKPFVVSNIIKKEISQSAPLPFTTSTLQQEASNKLGIGVKDVMSYAQKLFEGINVNGEHKALITYHRSDDATISSDFIPYIHDYIECNYGKQFVAKNVNKAKKNENVQAGHEAIRVIDLLMTPEKLSKYLSEPKLLKVYELIFKRTIASQMMPRKVSDTQYLIKNGKYNFSMSSKEELFVGWKRAYSYEKENEEVIKETFVKGENLEKTSLEALEKKTTPPSRFTEATLIKTLDKLGIGRPSTYATIITTLLDPRRGYCEVQNKKLVPSDLAFKLVDFLDKHFNEIVSAEYTSHLEKSLDEIAEGKLKRVDFLRTFYGNLENDINKVMPNIPEKICPECGSKLVVRRGRYGLFLGCSNYPKCKHIEKLKK